MLHIARYGCCSNDKSPSRRLVPHVKPIADRVILWTRLTPRTVNETTASYDVAWTVYSGVDLATVVQTGNTNTSAERDFTVKVSAHQININLCMQEVFASDSTQSSRLHCNLRCSASCKDINSGMQSTCSQLLYLHLCR